MNGPIKSCDAVARIATGESFDSIKDQLLFDPSSRAARLDWQAVIAGALIYAIASDRTRQDKRTEELQKLSDHIDKLVGQYWESVEAEDAVEA